jgi:hypothetical protein
MRISYLFLTILMATATALPQWIRTNGPEGVAISSLSNIDGTIYAGTKVSGVVFAGLPMADKHG